MSDDLTTALLLLAAVVPAVCTLVLARSRSAKVRSFPCCGCCGHDVSGTSLGAARCPECGRTSERAGIVPARRGRNGWSMLLQGAALAILWGTSSAFLVEQAMRARPATVPNVPPPITAQQAAAMTKQQALTRLANISTARRAAKSAGDTRLENRLKSDFDLLMARIKGPNRAGAADDIETISANDVILALEHVRARELLPFLMQVTGKQVFIAPEAYEYTMSLTSDEPMPRLEAVARIFEQMRDDGLDVRMTSQTIEIFAGRWTPPFASTP